VGDSPRTIQRHHSIAYLYLLDGLEAVVPHHHSFALGHAVFRRVILHPGVLVLAVAELVPVAAGEDVGVRGGLPLAAPVDLREHPVSSLEGVLQGRHDPAEVERPAHGGPGLQREGVILGRVTAARLLQGLVDRVPQQDQ